MRNKKTIQHVHPHTHFIDKLAFANGIISGIALFPQTISVLTTGDIRGVSILTALLIWINSLIWFAYSIHRGIVSIRISSTLNTISSTILLIAIINILVR